MSKPLSEQDFTDIYLNILNEISWLRDAHGDLEADYNTLKAQLEDCRSGYRNVKTERDRLATENAEFESVGNRSLEKISELEAENDRLHAENTALRAGQGRWPDETTNNVYVTQNMACDHGGQVPRVISAEELRVGQRVAVMSKEGVYQGGGRFEGIRNRLAGGHWFEVSTGRKGGDAWIHDETDTIVLLADATEPEPTVVHDDGGKPWSVEVRPVADPAPRLTVHALNTAPVGSWLNRGGSSLPRLIKQPDGLWAVSITHVGLSSEFALSEWPDATLSYPKRGDHE